jgi:predicted permease
MGTFIQDLRFGLRTLLKAPGFTFIAILTLALGIGANSALFSVVNGVLLNPLPYPEPDKLVSVYASSPEFEHSSVTYLNYLDWEKDNQSFEHLGIFRSENLFLTGAGEGERVRGYMVSSSFFRAMRVQPVQGRLLRPEEDRVGGTPVVMISEGLWKRRYGGASDIIGKSITLTGKSFEVIGIIPGSFVLYSQAREVYVPIGQWDDATFRDRHVSMGANVIGRLRPGVNLMQAKLDMDRIAKNLAETYPDSNKGMGIALLTFKEDVTGDIKPFLLVLLGAVGFVLLIACANVANLLLARATGRTREFAVRAALGATRMRVIRQLLTESVLLAITGGALGLTVAYWGTKAILGALPQVLPRVGEIGLDSHVLLFTFVVSLLVGVIFGLVPALRLSRTTLQETLKEGGRGGSGTRHRAQGVFVVVEMAMALVLLVGAGLMFRTLSALWSVDPGFNPHNVITFDMTMPRGVVGNPQVERTLLRNIHETLVAVPGVQFASLQGGSLPMNGDSELPFWLEGQPKPATQNDMPFALFYLVEPEYLKAMGTPLLRGRFLTDQDNEHSQPVVVIDEMFARSHFKDQDPLGKRLNLGIIDTQAVIVGVAGHVKHWGLDSDAKSKLQAQMYIPFMQLPDRFMPLLSDGVGLVARTQGPTGNVLDTIQHTMGRMSSEQVVYGIRSLDEIVADSLAARRFSMILLGVFAGLALVLASVGIYGVISYVVGQRTHEIGIRMALGAQRGDVLRLVLRQGAVMALVGVVIGVGATIGLTRLMASMLFSVSATDPVTLIGVSAILTAVALLACYIPARRAMRTDPVIALRYE